MDKHEAEVAKRRKVEGRVEELLSVTYNPPAVREHDWGATSVCARGCYQCVCTGVCVFVWVDVCVCV